MGRFEEASEHLKPQRLLLVFDQFEEFLVMYDRDPSSSQEIIELLSLVHSSRVDNLKILLVLRSDYVGLLQQLNESRILPFIDFESNAKAIAAFRELHARAFLEQSPLDIPADLMNDIFTQMREIEPGEGLFRPIILNMMGLFLERKATNEKRPIERLRNNFLEDHLYQCVRRKVICESGSAICE